MTRRGLPEQEDLGARLLTARTPGFSFTTVCVPSASRKERAAKAEAIERKLGWLDALLRYLGTPQDGVVPSLVCGDFNITPAPMDGWQHWHEKREDKSEPGFRDDERSKIRSLQRSGWFDLVRHVCPDAKLFSWWWKRDFYLRNMGLRLDLVLGNSAVVDRLRSARIVHSPFENRGRTGKPDHAPVIVDLA